MDNRVVGVEERLNDGRIQELHRYCREIKLATDGSKDCWPSHKETVRQLFGGLVGMCYSHPHAVALFIWKLYDQGGSKNGT